MGRLQLYYILNDSSTTKDASFHVESSKSVTTYKLQSRTFIAVSYPVFMSKYSCMYDNKTQADYGYDCPKRGTTYQLLLKHREVFANTL